MRSKSVQSAESNPAVFRCCQKWEKAYQEAIDDKEDDDVAASRANCAYREAMPPLDGTRNVRNFIACVTHGLMIGAIDGSDYTRLLYAIQVAHTTRRVRKPKAKTGKNKSHLEAANTQEDAALEPLAPPVQAAQAT